MSGGRFRQSISIYLSIYIFLFKLLEWPGGSCMPGGAQWSQVRLPAPQQGNGKSKVRQVQEGKELLLVLSQSIVRLDLCYT